MSSKKKDQAIDRQIDDNLRRIFEEDVEAGLPPHLRRLIEQLDTPDPNDDADDKNGQTALGAMPAGAQAQRRPGGRLEVS